MLILPDAIRAQLKGQKALTDTTGLSSAQVLLYPNAVLKIRPNDDEARREASMLPWLETRLPAPRLLAHEVRQGTDYLLMSRLPGSMLCADAFLDDPPRLIDRLAEALTMLWSVDVTGCPCDCSLAPTLQDVERRLRLGLLTDFDASRAEGFATPATLLDWLERHQPAEQAVLSHGDCCLPNLLADAEGKLGLIDLGNCGIADPYQDIALVLRSLRQNLSGVFGGRPRPPIDPQGLFDRLQLAPDWDRLRYYTLLNQLL